MLFPGTRYEYNSFPKKEVNNENRALLFVLFLKKNVFPPMTEALLHVVTELHIFYEKPCCCGQTVIDHNSPVYASAEKSTRYDN